MGLTYLPNMVNIIFVRNLKIHILLSIFLGIFTFFATPTEALAQAILPVSRGGTGTGSFTVGSLLFYNGSTITEDNSNLFWDDTNNRLGIGTSSPTTTLDVSGNAKVSSLTSSGDATINSLNVGLGGGSVFSNTSIGAYTLVNSNSSSEENTAVGYRALSNVGSSAYQTAVGFYSLINSTGDGNTAIGQRALSENTTGVDNLAVGRSALAGGNIGNYNVALGTESLTHNHEGSFNIGIGYHAGDSYPAGLLTSPENSIYIGYFAKGYDNNDSNSIVIGSGAVGAGANKAVFGNSAMSDVYFGSSSGLSNIHAKRLFLGSSSIIPGCIIMEDSDGNGITYLTVNDGVLSASSTQPSTCQ